MFTLIFDTYSGLCNQMYDIQAAVNYCLAYNIPFSFRYASLRMPHDLCKWYDIPFEDLFDGEIFDQFPLYKRYSTLNCNPRNTHHYNNPVRAIEWLNVDRAILPQLEYVKKDYIVLRQFWSIPCNVMEQYNLFSMIKPCEKLDNRYRMLANKLLPSKYNLIHYRYEDDFNAHFKIVKPLKLCDIIRHVKFYRPELPTYIATNRASRIPPTLLSTPLSSFGNIICKPEGENDDLNFEEAAFVDFMIGKTAHQIYGHHNSSFSVLLNSNHATNHYYDLEMGK